MGGGVFMYSGRLLSISHGQNISDGFENARYQKMMINNELAIILMVNNDDFQSVIFFIVCLEMRKKCSYNHH